MSSGTVWIVALKDNEFDAIEFPGTTAGLQAAIDYGAGGKVEVYIGPGTLEITTVISVHANVAIRGSGVGVTIIKRATGSLTSGDAAHSGDTFISTAFGSNGTIATNSTGQSDITICDLTIDGNQSNFGAVDPSTPRHIAIQMPYQDGLRVFNVEIKEFLQTGIHLDEARKVFIDRVRVHKTGQYGSASARNGISLVNSNSFLAGYSTDAVLSNLVLDTITDAFVYNNYSNVTIENVVITGGGLFGFELETLSGCTAVSNVSIANVVATGLTKEFIRLGQLSGSATTFDNVKARNCHCTFSASAHVGFAVRISNSTNVIVRGFQLAGCTFKNCNSGDAANIPFIFADTTNTTTASSDIALVDLVLECGATSSTTTSSHGMDISGHTRDVTIRNCVVRDATGIGILVRAKTAGATMRDVTIDGCYVYNSTNDGIQAVTGNATGTIKNVIIRGCYVEDCAEATGTAGITVGPTTAGSTGSNISVVGNRINQVSSTTMVRGIRVEAGAAATSDNYHISGNDTIGLGSGSDLDYQNTGTSTNVHFDEPVWHGSDISSAATVTLRRGRLFHVTGTTAITTLNPQVAWERRPITFIMDSTASFTDGGNMKLAGNGPNTADDTITMAYDGTSWYEVARSVN